MGVNAVFQVLALGVSFQKRGAILRYRRQSIHIHFVTYAFTVCCLLPYTPSLVGSQFRGSHGQRQG